MSDILSTSTVAPDSTPRSPHSESLAAGAGCPPPLRCREVADVFEQQASPWELQGSLVGTHGWCWGSGPSLYLLSPFGGNARLFALLAYLLHDQYRCILVDWHGPVGKKAPTLDLFASELEQVLSMAGEDAAAIYGSSFGAAVALRTAARAPDKVGALILQDVARQRRLSLGERILCRWFRHSTRKLKQLPGRTRIAEVNHRRWFPPLDPDRWNWFLEVTGKIPLKLLAAQADSIHRIDQTDDLRCIACPALLLDVEGAGPHTRAEQRQVRQLLPRGKSASLHTTGYYPGLTHPHRMKKLLEQFLDSPRDFPEDDATPEIRPLSALSAGIPSAGKSSD